MAMAMAMAMVCLSAGDVAAQHTTTAVSRDHGRRARGA